MSNPEHRAVSVARLIRGATAALLLAFAAASVSAQVLPPHPNAPKANWAQFEKFSAANIRGMAFSTNITPRWIGETDSLFYSWQDRTGTRWYLINATTHAKKPLLDQVKLAAQLSVLHKTTFEPLRLADAFSTMNITKDHKNFRFQVDSTRYNWAIATEVLTSLGRYRGAADSAMTKDEETDGAGGGGGRGGGGGGGRGAAPPAGGTPEPPPDFRNWSPDSTAFAFGRNNNLYVYEKARNDTVQITTEGVTGYSFTAGGGRGGGGQQDSTQQQQDDNNGRGGAAAANRNVRATVTWSPDSKSFYFTRSDNRAGRELYLVNVLSEPRPTLSRYSYYMPAEDSVPRPEAWTFTRGEKAAKKTPVTKWKDQQYFSPGAVYSAAAAGGGRGGGGGGGGGLNPYTTKDGTKMRIIRRDRLQRNLELVEVDIPTGQTKVLVTETKGESGSLEMPNPVYLKSGGDFIWWSERSGYGHFYLYANDGTLKKQLTSGDWRAESGLVDVDTVRNVIYVRGEGREPGENLYNQHLYKVGLLDGSITLLDPGNYNHSSSVSKNKKWVVDQSSRVDTLPRTQLRDAMTGKLVMDLEAMDMTRLFESGWRYPSTFQTLAADGVTPIFGNMWKPFDFDSTKKYPIIAHVYPGPQTESVTGAFNPGTNGGPQQLAQLGFIVVQIGNRGGTPARSAAYQDFSYFNMRDYALADKKTGIEQLASRYKWMDIDRVGIYGHSGGGFLTGAALLLPPFNEFFKVGVSESGNHDNNVYNSNWSEQYHGLKWVAAADTARLTAEARAKGRSADFAAGVAIATTELGGRGGRGGRGGQGGGTGGRGGGGGGNGGRGGRGGNGAGGGTAGAQNPGGNGAAAGIPGTPPDSAFWIYIPTNIDIASNLKGKLLLETGDMDNNVHPAGTIRLVNALIQNNKRFDLMIYPGQPHAYGPMAPYAWQLQAEYFAEFLLGDRDFRMNADFRKHTSGQN